MYMHTDLPTVHQAMLVRQFISNLRASNNLHCPAVGVTGTLVPVRRDASLTVRHTNDCRQEPNVDSTRQSCHYR